MGSWNSICIVTPPTLKAARPVGAATAHNKSSELHMLISKIFMVSIKKDFPVPPTPLSISVVSDHYMNTYYSHGTSHVRDEF